jgi:transcriptional regulator with XRE-family HTH domain
MRPSPLRHPLAVLRQVIGLGQKELADLIKKSPATIQAIELGKLKLSEELALKISVETGVSIKWLLNGDPQAEPAIEFGPLPGPEERFTREHFEWVRAERTQSREGGIILLGLPWYDAVRLDAIKHAATESGNWKLVNYRISKFLDELESEFGGKLSKEQIRWEARRADLPVELVGLFEDPNIKTGDPNPPQRYYREFVPTFIKTFERLVRVSEARRKKAEARGRDFQEPGLLPLLWWALRASRFYSPQHPHPLLKKFLRSRIRHLTDAAEKS